LTSCAFLFLSGFVFVFVTDRRIGRKGGAWAAVDRRLRRFVFFLLLGYALHLPVSKLTSLTTMGSAQWRSFLAVDVLQCIAVMLTFLQILAAAVRTPRYRAAVVAGAGVLLVAGMPAMWRMDWAARLPLSLASYLSPATGSVFPLFPWGAFVLLGAVAGHLHARFTARMGPDSLPVFARRVLLPGGAVLLAVSEVGWQLPWWPFGPTDFWVNSPSLFCLRAGLVLVLVGALARVVPRISRTPYVLQAVARQSLVVYAVHLCLVYGSIWNTGLKQAVGASLPLVPALGVVAGIWTAMAGLAVAWHWSRHHYPGVAWWVRAATWVVLVGMLI
ncbi:MAG: heparan-alpha-glucosaminide N-acetyltransferase domain-containing protein, partial [Vicinamibacterales bacterium]